MRKTTAGAYSLLEWGQKTDTPRSVVRDRDGAMVFTGSLVEGPEGDRGKVMSMHSVSAVEVAWVSGWTDPKADPRVLRVMITSTTP